jgi:hypothetical protein
MKRFVEVAGKNHNAKRAISAVTVSAILIACIALNAITIPAATRSGPTSTPTVVGIGGNPYWDVVGSMILYRNDSKAGNQSYWVAQSFQVQKQSPASIVVSLIIYVWLARDTPPNSSFPTLLDNITVFLTNATASGDPNIDSPIANQTISPENISAAGPYPEGLMETNSSLAVQLQFNTTSLLGFAEGEYFIFMSRKNLGDNDDYHLGYAYYWAASKLDLYYGGESWVLANNGEWKSYRNDMCFLLVEVTIP